MRLHPYSWDFSIKILSRHSLETYKVRLRAESQFAGLVNISGRSKEEEDRHKSLSSVFVFFWSASVCIMFYSNCLCIAGGRRETENQKYDNIKLENSRDSEQARYTAPGTFHMKNISGNGKTN